MLCDAKVRYGRERAAAKVFDVVEEEEGEGGSSVDPPPGPETLFDEPCLGACCRRNCRAFARAFSCVRTKWARFYRYTVS